MYGDPVCDLKIIYILFIISVFEQHSNVWQIPLTLQKSEYIDAKVKI